ncbi:hypothetical protein EVAR_19733_1 [Eumeta japonica]|uniref:Uncharacterized protein n=1 Tax=Eumeta variegata TaxID=151549 RepID=A0A4C1URU2_EUMVA|nr:hypothetical protein EVAR_19733_1 [Eumeta japonica]
MRANSDQPKMFIFRIQVSPAAAYANKSRADGVITRSGTARAHGQAGNFSDLYELMIAHCPFIRSYIPNGFCRDLRGSEQGLDADFHQLLPRVYLNNIPPYERQTRLAFSDAGSQTRSDGRPPALVNHRRRSATRARFGNLR